VSLVSRHGSGEFRGRVGRRGTQRELRPDQGRPRGASGRRQHLHDRLPARDRTGRLAALGVAHPEGKPFFVGTYFPREGQQGQPGFLDLCERIADSWDSEDDREEMEHRAQQWTDAATDQLEETPDAAGAGTEAGSSPEPPSSDVLETAADATLRSADRQHGGFGSGQKFPSPRACACSLERTTEPVARSISRCSRKPSTRCPWAASTITSAAASTATASIGTGRSPLREDAVRQRRDSAGLSRGLPADG